MTAVTATYLGPGQNSVNLTCSNCVKQLNRG